MVTAQALARFESEKRKMEPSSGYEAPREPGVWSCDAVYSDVKDNPACAITTGCSIFVLILINVIIVLAMSIEQAGAPGGNVASSVERTPPPRQRTPPAVVPRREDAISRCRSSRGRAVRRRK